MAAGTSRRATLDRRLAFVAAGGLVLALAACPAFTSDRLDPVASVNVFTGTSNSRWQLFPGATLPFGMVELSPDNQANVWNGGYEYTIDSISGFSHLHAMTLSGRHSRRRAGAGAERAVSRGSRRGSRRPRVRAGAHADS